MPTCLYDYMQELQVKMRNGLTGLFVGIHSCFEGLDDVGEGEWIISPM